MTLAVCFPAGHTERAMLYHELEDGMYSVTSYFFAKVSSPMCPVGVSLAPRCCSTVPLLKLITALWMFTPLPPGPGGVTRALCVHSGLRPAHLLAGRPQRGSGTFPAQLPAGVADGVLQQGHGSVRGRRAAHPADLGLHGQLPVHRLLPDGRLRHQHGEHVAR